MIAASALGLLIGAICFGAFLIANYHSLGRGGAQNVAAAFESGSLGDRDYIRGDTRIGQHQFTDCLILGMALDQRYARERLTVSPSVPFRPGSTNLCEQLRTSVESPSSRNYFYHNYIHGHTMLVRYLLPELPVGTIRALYQFAITALLILGIAISMIRLKQGGFPEAPLLWLILFLSFSRWFGLETFGQSLTHGPPDLILVGFALFLSIGSPDLSARTAMVAAALFGSLTAIFEFMTGGLPLGLALLIGMLPFTLRAQDRTVRSVASAVMAFCAAAAACMVLKLVAVGMVFGMEEVGSIGQGLASRVAGATPGFARNGWASAVIAGLDALTPGMWAMAVLFLVLALGFGAWGLSELVRSGHAADAWLLAASNLPILLWFLIFRQHTIVHAWFTDRMFVWTIASGFALFALALVRRHRSPASAQMPHAQSR